MGAPPVTNVLEKARRVLTKKSVAVSAAILALVIAAAVFIGPRLLAEPAVEITYSEFTRQLADKKVQKVLIESGGLSVSMADRNVLVRMPNGLVSADYIERITASGAEVDFKKPGFDAAHLASILVPLVLVGAVLVMLAIQTDFKPTSRWPRVIRSIPNRFDDVAGQEEAKAELQEVIAFLRDSDAFKKVGARIPRGLLMVGPPGTGKTLIAKALAGEAGVSFMAVSGSDFSAPLIGIAKGRVSKLFEQARKKAPCLIFIDEIDAIGRKRGGGGSAADREFESTLNQLLVEMDGFNTTAGVIVIGATNRVDVLDPALLRPGRFDRQVHIGLPDIGGREAILNVHARNIKLAEGVSLASIAKGTPGFSGADLGNLLNEAAIFAAREGGEAVTRDHLEAARNKIIMGLERRSLVISDEERRLVAVHEAGHALCACLLPASDKVHSATIIPHGQALGLVMRLPDHDRFCIPVEKLEADLIVAMGGRAAEEVVFGPKKVTTGAASDIAHATNIVTKMVTEWGMSPAIGMVRVARSGDSLPREVEQEIRRIIDEMYAAAKTCIEDNRDALDALTKALLEHETIEGDEVRQIVAKQETRLAA
ncbi:ATP-dependent zinc metalloprotease FtsH [Microvirga tunisiensis]|jgi:cell division protease FtsH|uniref:ATP-dependent zinc metalloprotease FtsH n=1 Tax=Microvirga tunisiensis TaxID=2108360 RepID=A0A5N7MIC7_9HYPH|nr:ATP-dependent zinc metalloprotease FtsH [Microvirga tunisiensis]MPR08519.1 ATP-dependent zinc metalloprotease FtsH [Microvirga tunisiensis]MPR26785.1 ATP-dependent zinc metalloprotease FtsH [Microvirga tunisiensis]